MRVIGAKPDHWGGHFRFYGTKVSCECPECGATSEDDLGRDPLDDVAINGATPLQMTCGACHHEWEVHITVELTIRSSTAEEIAGLRPAFKPATADAVWDPFED